MRKTHSFRTNLERRESFITKFSRAIFLAFASPARLLIEVFIRKNFGERYFRFSAVLGLTVLLTLIPFTSYFITRTFLPLIWPTYQAAQGLGNMQNEMQGFMGSSEPASEGPVTSGITPASDEPEVADEVYSTQEEFLNGALPGMDYLLWFIFLAAFLGMGIRHLSYKINNPSGLDFTKYSYYGGDRMKMFYNFNLPWFKTTTRVVETIYEPLPFFFIGLLLYLIGQPLGLLFLLASIFYSLSYQAAYRNANENMMDRVDKMIINKQMSNFLQESFKEAEQEQMRDGSKTDYYEPRARRPIDADARRRILQNMVDDQEAEEAI